MTINSNNRGFTLIELLVVIAIIGILASVVLASLNSARAKGADAAVKSNLNNMRAQAAIVYDSATPNAYTNVCSDDNVEAALTAAKTAGGDSRAITAMCVATADTWAASALLKTKNGSDDQWWCVDSAGASGLETAATITGGVCP